MKTVGLLGGMSWKSSLDYYRMINEMVHEKLGDWNSAKIVMYSVNFNEIDIEHQTPGWEVSDKILINAVKSLEKAGAEAVILACTELPLIVSQKDVKIRLFDTAQIHSENAAEYAIN